MKFCKGFYGNNFLLTKVDSSNEKVCSYYVHFAEDKQVAKVFENNQKFVASMKWIEEIELSSMNINLYIEKLQVDDFFSTDLYHDYNRLHQNHLDIIDYSEKFNAKDYILKVLSHAFDNNIFLTGVESFDYEDFFSELYSTYCYEK